MLPQNKVKYKAYELRQKILKIISDGQSGHAGGDMSEIDILTVLFYRILNIDVKNPSFENRDRFILSKGHAVEAYYAVLADLGFICEEQLQTFSQFRSNLIGHPNCKVPGIEVNSGALGHGLSIGVGMALAAMMDNRPYKVFVLMGDGEQAEGSVWEAAMAASQYKLNHLCAIIDRNKLQISGKTEDVMALEPLRQKWEAFGFEVIEVDGHNYKELETVLLKETQKPKLMIAHTVKGKGVSFMENNVKWHHGVPNAEQLEKALQELDEEKTNE